MPFVTDFPKTKGRRFQWCISTKTCSAETPNPHQLQVLFSNLTLGPTVLGKSESELKKQTKKNKIKTFLTHFYFVKFFTGYVNRIISNE